MNFDFLQQRLCQVSLRHCTTLVLLFLWGITLAQEARFERLIPALHQPWYFADGIDGIVELNNRILITSIFQTIQYELSDTHVNLYRTTILGALKTNTLYASNSLITGKVDVVNNQDGCFRFSGAPQGSDLPKQYEPVQLLS